METWGQIFGSAILLGLFVLAAFIVDALDRKGQQ